MASRFEDYSEDVLPALMDLRQLILDTATTTEGVGPLEETLKWGQPSYLTIASKSGTTIRVGPSGDGHFALFVHCQTDLVKRFRLFYPDLMDFEGNRAIRFRIGEALPATELTHCISLALRYHLDK